MESLHRRRENNQDFKNFTQDLTEEDPRRVAGRKVYDIWVSVGYINTQNSYY